MLLGKNFQDQNADPTSFTSKDLLNSADKYVLNQKHQTEAL